MVDLLFENWKLIIKIDQNDKNLKFDQNLNLINKYKEKLIKRLFCIKNLVVNTSGRNSTSTNESKNLYNTRRETRTFENYTQSESLNIKTNIFNEDSVFSVKDLRNNQIKLADKFFFIFYFFSLIQDLENIKFDREFNLFNCDFIYVCSSISDFLCQC